MKRAGFTMIELIFVIVILGILAAVAIPKLAATRDDAKISAAATTVNTLLQDVTTYYTAKGDVNSTAITDITNASNSPGWSTTWAANSVNYAFTFADSGGTDCLQIDVNTSAADGTVSISTSKLNTTTAVCSGLDKLVTAQTVNLGGSQVTY
ncbi:type II secretion system protein [Sulfurimonas sp.]